MHLYITLQQAIGLKSPMTDALGFLGTKDKLVALISLSSKPVLKKSLIAVTTSFPTTDQEDLKNSTVKSICLQLLLITHD